MKNTISKIKEVCKEVKKEFVKGYRLARIQRDIQNGSVDQWILDITRGTVTHVFDPTIPCAALTSEDQTTIYFRLSEQELEGLASTSLSFKTVIQAVAAHEMGHVVDKDLAVVQKNIIHAVYTRNFERYRELVLRREHTAWELGKQFIGAEDMEYYNNFNETNIKKYTALMEQERGVWQ